MNVGRDTEKMMVISDQTPGFAGEWGIMILIGEKVRCDSRSADGTATGFLFIDHTDTRYAIFQ